MIHGDDALPSRLQYILHTDDGARYRLTGASNTQWRTHTRLKVNGRRQAAASLPGTVSIMPNLHVDEIVAVTPAPTTTRARFSTAAASASGSAPADMSVLFVIVTMCNLTPSITPAVSRDFVCELSM
jgi:hypothetical protein